MILNERTAALEACFPVISDIDYISIFVGDYVRDHLAVISYVTNCNLFAIR